MRLTFHEMYEIAYIICYIIKFLLALFGGYICVISLFALRRRKKEANRGHKPVNSFAMIIAAHNEENVIGDIVENLKKLDYPGRMYDIFVIADNCTDRTAEIARGCRAFVHERFSSSEKSKGHALKWMLNILFGLDKKYDAVCVFDADNLVSSNFLKEIDKKLCEGFKIVQGYRDIKNPFDSWVTLSYAITWWVLNRMYQLPRYYLGLSCMLTGSGFAVKTETLKEMGWDTASLTEDLEFSVQAVLKGVKVGWAHDAVVYDEQPLTLSQSWLQRKRWMQGHADCAARYTKALWQKAVNDKSIIAFDWLLFLIYPFSVVLGALMTLLDINYIILQFAVLGVFKIGYLTGLIMFYLLQYLFFLIFVRLENKYSFRILKGLLAFPLFGLTWIPIIIQGFLDRNKKQWTHTPHARRISVNELQE